MSRIAKKNLTLAFGLALSIGLGSETAVAFCRTTTCDVDDPPPECDGNAMTEDGCSTLGLPLAWPGRCSWFGVQESGSVKLHISYETFHDTVKRAFAKWASVDCGGGQHPSFDLTDTDELYGAAACDAPEFNGKAANASVWMFRDSNWSHSKNAIALTQVSADVRTGNIYDADVELNSLGVDISTSDTGRANLEAIVTHEAGHFLGLAHSLDPTATMRLDYAPIIRDLAPDDVAGICAVYPPSEGAPICGEPEPLYGFSRFCGGVSPSTTPETAIYATGVGCTVVRSRGRGSLWPASAAFAILLVARRSRRRLALGVRERRAIFSDRSGGSRPLSARRPPTGLNTYARFFQEHSKESPHETHSLAPHAKEDGPRASARAPHLVR